jgi:hypothetical protein
MTHLSTIKIYLPRTSYHGKLDTEYSLLKTALYYKQIHIKVHTRLLNTLRV